MTRALIAIVTSFVLMVVLGAVLRALGFHQVSLDVALIVVLYTAMVDRRGQAFRQSVALGGPRSIFDVPSVLVAFVLGYLADLLGGGVKGILALSLAVVFVFGRTLTRHVLLVGPVAQIFFTFVASLFTSILAMTLRWITGVPPSLGITLVLLAQAALTALAAPLLMGALRWVDMRLFADRGDRLSPL